MSDSAPPGPSEPTAPTAESGAPGATPATLGDLSRRMSDELARLDAELGEVDLLVNQARTEAGRHEARRVAAAEKLATAMSQAETSAQPMDPAVTADLNSQLVTLTKRAALMESQVDVLDGKRRALGRYREALAANVEAMSGFDDAAPIVKTGSGAPAVPTDGGMPPAVTRMLLDAQEDLRREIARQMHDGPAQSLTNIVLQAQIVERLVDPASQAAPEVRQLVAMVQQTLEATKSFIFDVRPMVLDDLGLMPTLRRSARERGGRSGVPIEFESLGADRRLSVDLESGLFRIVDEAIAAYLTTRAERIALRLDWSDQVEVTVSATRAAVAVAPDTTPDEASTKDLPPALAAMMEERRVAARDAAETARRESIVVLPPSTWREIQDRAATLGITAELQGEGSVLRMVVEATPPGDDGAAGT
jgi:two-component system, NarL family, sensor histidine kinase DegS